MERKSVGATAAELTRADFAAVAAKDLDRLASFWDEQTVVVFLALQREVVGEHDLRQVFSELFTAFPDLHFTTEAVHEIDESTAVGQWQLTGTFTGGQFQGMDPTDRPVKIRGVDVIRFENGTMRRNEVYYDGLTFARQVGMLPSAASTADRNLLTAFNTLTRAKHAVRERVGR
jgi:steroid delta-isomerase-like uncharacterized protein